MLKCNPTVLSHIKEESSSFCWVTPSAIKYILRNNFKSSANIRNLLPGIADFNPLVNNKKNKGDK